MSNQYSNLPGVNMSIKDGQLLLTNDRTSNSMLIIAEARTHRNTPEGPVLVTSESELKENFGGYFHQGTLNPIAAQWAIARQNGIRNIYLMALKKAEKKEQFVDLHDKLFNLMADLSLSYIVVDGLYADEEITGLVASDFGLTSFDDVDTIPAIYRRVGSAAIEDELGDVPHTLELVFNSGTIYIGNPAGSLDVNELNNELQKALSLEMPHVKATISDEGNKKIVTISANEAFEIGEGSEWFKLEASELETEGNGNVGLLLAEYAEKVSTEVGETIVFVGVKPLTSVNLAGIKEHVSALVKRDNAVSPYLQVVAGPQVGVSLPGNLRMQWVSGVTQYAALVSGLSPQNAPTNQLLPGAAALRYNLSLRQLNDLTGSKYVTFHVKNGQIRVVDGVTTAPDLLVGQDVQKSDFTRLSTLRIVNFMVREIRNACDAYIGSPNEFANYNAMNTSIKGVIDMAIDRGIIQDARYSIKIGTTLDSSNIELTILPQFELRTINVTVGLSTPDNF